MENQANRNIMPEIVIFEPMERLLRVIGKLSIYPSQIDSTHLKRGAAEMLDTHLQPELPFEDN